MPASQYFRAGVGAIIRNAAGQVLAFERTGNPGAWQLPQGGLEDGEEPLDGIYREIAEETGIRPEALAKIMQYPEPLAYELPLEARSAKTGRGQTQIWFLFELTPEASVVLPAGGEFRDWRWMRFDDLAANVVGFRQRIYRRLADWLKEL